MDAGLAEQLAAATDQDARGAVACRQVGWEQTVEVERYQELNLFLVGILLETVPLSAGQGRGWRPCGSVAGPGTAADLAGGIPSHP